MIVHDKGHLAVRQHRGLGAPGGAGGEEEPAGSVDLDPRFPYLRVRMRGYRFADGFLAERALSDAPNKGERRARRFDGGGMIGKIAMAEKRLGAGRWGGPG